MILIIINIKTNKVIVHQNDNSCLILSRLSCIYIYEMYIFTPVLKMSTSWQLPTNVMFIFSITSQLLRWLFLPVLIAMGGGTQAHIYLYVYIATYKQRKMRMVNMRVSHDIYDIENIFYNTLLWFLRRSKYFKWFRPKMLCRYIYHFVCVCLPLMNQRIYYDFFGSVRHWISCNSGFCPGIYIYEKKWW